jgi:hypothetical protein
LKWNDCVGEGVLNISKYLRKAYKRNIAIKLFEQKQGAAKVREKMQGALPKKEVLILDDQEDIPDDEEDNVELNTMGNRSASGFDVKNPMLDDDADSDDDDTGVGFKAALAKSKVC